MVDPGDYEVGVHGFEFSVAQSSGSEILTLKLETIGIGSIVHDNLVFQESAQWKIDTALKCFMEPSKLPKKGEDLDINEEWVKANLLGLTGVVSLTKKEYTRAVGDRGERVGTGKWTNEVGTYYDKAQGKAAMARKNAAPAAAKATGTAAKSSTAEKGPF